MATNHSIAAPHVEHRHDIGSDSTAGFAVIAFLLALILGFSAVDIHQRALDIAAAGGPQLDQTVLDGRGKWAGYF